MPRPRPAESGSTRGPCLSNVLDALHRRDAAAGPATAVGDDRVGSYGDPTLASRLERDRLLLRARRIERVLAALEDRSVHPGMTVAETPPPLRHAIADFRIELRQLKRRLSELPS